MVGSKHILATCPGLKILCGPSPLPPAGTPSHLAILGLDWGSGGACGALLARDWWPLQGGIQAEGGLGYVLQGITSAKAKPNLLLYPRLKRFELAILPAFHIWGE